METPDFEKIARDISTFHAGGDPGMQITDMAEQLHLVWNAGKEAGEKHELFVNHLKDENNAAHQALDHLGAPTTKQVTRRDGVGKQDITIGIAERIDLARRLLWNARGAADLVKLEAELSAMMGATASGPLVKNLDQALRSLDR